MAGVAVTNPPASPSHSPRLPSPPPLTEVQFGPRSPGLGGVGDSGGSLGTSSVKGGQAIDLSGASSSSGSDGVLGSSPSTATSASRAPRRIRPGTATEEMSAGPPLVTLSELDSAFQLQEHLKALYQTSTQPEDSSHTIPITHSTALELATPPDGVDKSLWLYELCRLLTLKLNTIVVAFFTDDPPCSAATCPEMRASEWQYLCAVHDPPKPCCAIDYSCHTLDWAANMLTSPKHFPSRLTLGGGGAGGATHNGQDKGDAGGGGATGSAQHQQGIRNLTNVCRRLYRIFAHAWYQHRAVFWQVESMTGLYVFFKTVCDMYQLIPEDNYTVPPEAEGDESTAISSTTGAGSVGGGDSEGHAAAATGGGAVEGNKNNPPPTILRKQGPPASRPLSTVDSADGDNQSISSSKAGAETSTAASSTDAIGDGTSAPSTTHTGKPTARRHMTALSVGGSPSVVTTVPEEEENEVGSDNVEKDVAEVEKKKAETEEQVEAKQAEAGSTEDAKEASIEEEPSEITPPEPDPEPSSNDDDNNNDDDIKATAKAVQDDEPSKEEVSAPNNQPDPYPSSASSASPTQSSEVKGIQDHRREAEVDEGRPDAGESSSQGSGESGQGSGRDKAIKDETMDDAKHKKERTEEDEPNNSSSSSSSSSAAAAEAAEEEAAAPKSDESGEPTVGEAHGRQPTGKDQQQQQQEEVEEKKEEQVMVDDREEK